MKAIIIDDEPMASNHLLQMVLKHCFEISTTKVYNVASKALEHLKTNTYDILFLDIEMPGMNGFEFLTHAGLSNNTCVIFTTAYSQYAVEAFKANASHYLLKPIMENDLINAVRRVCKQKIDHNTREKDSIDALHIFDGDSYIILDKSDIVRLEADGSYTRIITRNDEVVLSSKRLSYYEDLLNLNQFFRCHKSHLICLKEITNIDKGRGGFINLKNKESIPVSQLKKDELKKMLGF